MNFNVANYRFIVSELVSTEKDYVNKLQFCIEVSLQ